MSRTLAAAAAIATLFTVTIAPPAAAATVTVDYSCAYMHIIVPHTFDITITAPATATRGTPTTISATVVSRHPLSSDQPAGAYQGDHSIVLGGADTGSVLVAPMASPALDAGEPWQITGSTQTTFDTAGTVTLKPDITRFSRPGYLGCIPKSANSAPVAATVQVS